LGGLKYSGSMKNISVQLVVGACVLGAVLLVSPSQVPAGYKPANDGLTSASQPDLGISAIANARSSEIRLVQNRSVTVTGKSTLNLDAERTAKDRKVILSNLYERLQASDSKETAERLVAAIEKIWLASGSDTVDLLMSRASTAFDNDDFELAKQLLDSITDLDPNYSEGWSKRAMISFKQDDYLSSLKDLERVLALDPRHFRAIQGVGLIFQQFGKKKQALELFRKVLKINPYSETAERAESELAREVEGQGI